jgi:hypothetical protein
MSVSHIASANLIAYGNIEILVYSENSVYVQYFATFFVHVKYEDKKRTSNSYLIFDISIYLKTTIPSKYYDRPKTTRECGIF